MKNLFKEAHKMAREIKEQYNEVDYQAQFGLCLSYLYENKEEMKVKELPKLEGTEKQVAWAEDIREELLAAEDNGGSFYLLANVLAYTTESASEMIDNRVVLSKYGSNNQSNRDKYSDLLKKHGIRARPGHKSNQAIRDMIAEWRA